MERLLDDMIAKRASLGLTATSPDLIEVCAYVGFRWVMLDQMFTGSDWSRTEELIRAAQASGVTPVIRLQSNPWLGYDHRIAVDFSRAMGIGGQFIMVSHSDVREIEECIVASRDWHRKPMTVHPYRSLDDWGTERPVGQRTFVIPHAETVAALEALEETIRNPEIHIVFIAMTDASRVITKKERPDFYNAALWRYVDRAVAVAREHDVMVGASTSWAYSLEEMRRRVEVLHEHGVTMIMTQGAPYLLQLAATKFLDDLRPALER